MQYYLCKYITILLQNATLTFQKCNTIFPKKKKRNCPDQFWNISSGPGLVCLAQPIIGIAERLSLYKTTGRKGGTRISS